MNIQVADILYVNVHCHLNCILQNVKLTLILTTRCLYLGGTSEQCVTLMSSSSSSAVLKIQYEMKLVPLIVVPVCSEYSGLQVEGYE